MKTVGHTMQAVLAMLLIMGLGACSQGNSGPAQAASPAGRGALEALATEIPAGDYGLDKSHASLLFRVSHLGFSMYTARFTRFDAQLQFDPAQPETSAVTVQIDPRSLETDYPDPAQLDFNAMLLGEQWLDAARHPDMSFRSTRIERTGPDTLRIHGELQMRGVTRPMALDAKFNGGYASHPMDPHARIGFSARGSLKRSEFGMSLGIPEAGSSMGVSDEVEVIVEAEFSGPPWANAPGKAAESF